MNHIKYKTSLGTVLLAGMAFLTFGAMSVHAQFVPGPAYYPDMGVMGSVTAAYTSAAQQNAYMQDRQLQATSSMAKSAAWMGLNRSMQSEAASRPSTVPDSAQAARDWMFQNTSSSRTARRPTTLPAANMAVVSPTVKTTKPAQKEIMLWPTLLKEQQFSTARAEVEAPFRRAYADGKPLTIDDYEGIIKAVTQLKEQIKGLESQLVETEYNSVQKYLDDLIADAQKRIKARE